MESRSETTQTMSALKLSVVIVNGDLITPVASASAGAKGYISPKTAKQKLEAITNRFGGNKESKKMQKTILKQNYENFTEDANLKLLRSLPSAWNNIALIMRNKSDLDTLSMDDLYNNLKVYESEIKGQSSSNSNYQNLAFVSSDNSSSTNETVNTSHSIFAATSKDQGSTGSYADDVMFSFFTNQSNASQLDNEDLEHIDVNNIEEMDLKWKVAMLTMRVNRFIKKTGRKLDLNGKETVGFDMIKVECYNCHRRGYFARECRAPRNQGNRNRDAPSRNAPVDTSATNELVHQVHQVQTLSAIDKTGLGYDGQMNESDLNDIHVNESEVLNNVFDSRESNGNDNQVNDRFKKSEGYHAVLSPYTGNYMPPRADLSFAGLDNSVFKSKVSKTITSVPKIETNASKTSKDSLEKPKIVRSSAHLIEEWESYSKDENVFKPKEVKKVVKPSLEQIEFVNARNTTVENESKVDKPKKFSQSPRDYQEIDGGFVAFGGYAKGGPKCSEDEIANDAGKKSTEVPRKENGVQDPAKEGEAANTNRLNTVSSLVNADTGIFSGANDDEVEGVVVDFNNLELTTVRDDEILICQDKYVADILMKFDFSPVKTARTPIKTNKALLKDEEAANVDVHLYKLMIGSLMYLTASRPNIMFTVCACTRF
nr:hypothetical protein [Tanacetum cinerariifolium]